MILTATEHSELAYRKAGSFAFARRLNAVPVLLNEIPRLLAHYPIVFSAGKAPTFVALLGARDAENLFVRADGSWLPDVYVPAYLRRYPFIMTQLPDKQMVFERAARRGVFSAPRASPCSRAAIPRRWRGRPTSSAPNSNRLSRPRNVSAAPSPMTACSAASAAPSPRRAGRASVSRDFPPWDEAVLDELDNRTANHYRKQHWLGALYCHVASLERLHTFPMLLDRRNAG